MLTKTKRLRIRDELLVFGKTQRFFKSVDFTGDPTMDRFVIKNPNAFLIAVICDYGMNAQKAWQLPYFLKKRLGYFDVGKIANMNEDKLAKIIGISPKLHRFPSSVAKFIIQSAKLLVKKYKAEAKNIWSDKPTAQELEKKFIEFPGIGQKKASMAVNILLRDLKVPIRDKSGINVSYDVHVKRVFSRSGLSGSDDQIDVIISARDLNPKYPGALDFPAWVIGQKFCRPQNPECRNCPLVKECENVKQNQQ